MQECDELAPAEEPPFQFALRELMLLTLASAGIFAFGRDSILNYLLFGLITTGLCLLSWKVAHWLARWPGAWFSMLIAGVVLASGFMIALGIALELAGQLKHPWNTGPPHRC
jgi:hypothetical protein